MRFLILVCLYLRLGVGIATAVLAALAGLIDRGGIATAPGGVVLGLEALGLVLLGAGGYLVPAANHNVW
jgi:hypothetical protein